MKRFLSAMLALLMLAGLVAAPAPVAKAAVADTTATQTDGTCTCGCGTALDAVQWEPWDPNTTGLLGGHFYLDGDYTHTKQYQINSGVRVVLDLRGHKLTTEKSRLFLIYGYAAVIDTVGGGRLCASATGTANGGAIMVAWDAVAMNDELDATFAMYNCTATLEKDKSGKNGGLFNVGNNSTLEIHNSTLLNASALERGGAIYATSGSTVTLTGSQILGCSAANAGGAIYVLSGTVTLKNCVLTGSETDSYGGNIYANNGSLTVDASIIESGFSNAAANGGGNLYTASGCKVNMTDSTVRNGYAAANGGNIFFGKGTQTLKNVKISAGVAGNQGANLYCTDATAVTTLEACEITGDVHYQNGSLTLKGTTTIGMNSTGLRTANVALNTTGLTGQVYMAEDGYCPHCSQKVTWTEAGTSLSGHCYLTADTALTEGYAVTDDVVLDLRGFDITSSDRAFTVAAGGALALLDSAGGSTVTASGNTEGLGGVIYNAGTLRIYGGNYIYAADATKPVANGGVIYTTGPMEIQGGSFDGSAFNSTTAGTGGALCVGDGAIALTMTAGYMAGGNAFRGGNVCFGSNNIITITGGQFVGGESVGYGGNIRFNAASKNICTASITGVLVKGGHTTGSSSSGGGALAVNYTNLTMKDCLVVGGTTTTNGGNFIIGGGGQVDAQTCVILSGSALKGGNLYSSSYLGGGDFTDCLITDGTATGGNGGNLLINQGHYNIYGGKISYGTASASGGNISTNSGNNDNKEAANDHFCLAANKSGQVPMIVGGSAKTSGGNIYSTGVLKLDAAALRNGTASSGKDLYYGKGNTRYSLHVGAGLTGQISMCADPSVIGSGVYGMELANATGVDFPGQLFLEGYDNLELCVQNGKLFAGAVAVQMADGSALWYSDVANAVAACPKDGWVKLYTDCDLVLTKDCYVDLNGKTAAVSGNGTLYGMDSSSDGYTVPTGKAQWAAASDVKTATLTDAPSKNRYLAVTEGNTVTYHRLEMKLTNVTLRTEKCGVYYKGTWGCDSVLADLIDSYGITVSVHSMPKADFESDPKCLSASYDGESLVSGAIQTGVLIKNIMRDTISSVTNQARGEMPIYAAAYVKLKNGAVYISDREGTQDDVAYSLRTTMERMDNLIATQPGLCLRDDVQAARDFYAAWKDSGMQNWSFDKLREPEDDGVLKIIILGSSRSVNTFQLLYEAFKDQMPDQKLELGIMYYSGCSMTMHKRFIETDQAVYHYYHNDNGRWTITPGKLMREGLLAENWDVVMLQAGSGDLDKEMQKDVRNFLKDYIDDYVIDPYELWWHSTWFNSTDPSLYTGNKTPEDAAAVDQKAQLTETNEAAKAYVLNDPMFAGHIASGTPVMYALKRLNVAETDLFRDHTHLYDLGCLLVGFSWYAQYTGNPVTEINLTSIPAHLRHSTHQSQGDFLVTQEMKDMIIESVAYTLSDPWSVPWSE